MHWLLGTYTARFNRRHKLIGHLFGGRYKALIVDCSGTGYLKTVCDYVHLKLSRKGDRRKVRIAWRLRTETTMTLKMDSSGIVDGHLDTRLESVVLPPSQANHRATNLK